MWLQNVTKVCAVILFIMIIGGMASAVTLPENMSLSADGVMNVKSGDVVSGLYDQTHLKTVYIEFSQDNWWAQLTANYSTGIDIPADMTCDGTTYKGVGVRFRGNTSYTMVQNSQKKSFNITVDYTDSNLDFMGFRTLNLNNSHVDASFMREVLYFDIVRAYTPCPMANFVKLVINGENWGVYVNTEQINSDMVEKWFMSSDGDHWKAEGDGGGQINTRKIAAADTTIAAPPDSTVGGRPNGGFPGGGGQIPGGGGQNPGGGTVMFPSGEKALTWLGSDASAYQTAYSIKSSHSDDPWASLINTCNILNNLPLESLPDTLDTVMDVDRWLWFIAAESIFTDADSYLTKGADYSLYYEPETGRLHPLQHDGNETFTTQSVNQSPFEGETNANRPVISRLLAVPEYRQRYCAHVRTIVDEYLDWSVIGPKIAAFKAVIDDEVKADTKKLYTDEAYDASVQELQNFVTARRNYLLQLDEIKALRPEIASVVRVPVTGKAASSSSADASIITAEITGNTGEVYLYYGKGYVGTFDRTAMFDDGMHGDGSSNDGVWGGTIPALKGGSIVRYYIEVRSADASPVSVFSPSGAEHDVYYFENGEDVPVTSPVFINEVMADNVSTIEDSHGNFSDWIELFNTSDRSVDISGMYLSDSGSDPCKWQFPDGTILNAGEHILVWADDGEESEEGYHATFKISAKGETIYFVDTDANGNRILDSLDTGKLGEDRSYGRYPDGSAELAEFETPTPGTANRLVVSVDEQPLPESISLKQNFPNPFNNTTTIQFVLPGKSPVMLQIFNTLGQNVATIVNETLDSGTYTVAWNGCDDAGKELATGIYVYRLSAGAVKVSHNLLLLR